MAKQKKKAAPTKPIVEEGDSDASFSEALGIGGGSEDEAGHMSEDNVEDMGAHLEGSEEEGDEEGYESMSEGEGEDDDDELRRKFKLGLLAGKTVRAPPPKREFVNDEAGLLQRLAELRYPADMHWVQRMDLTSSAPMHVQNVEDDTERELAFYQQALEAAAEGRRRLEGYGIPTTRPEDYFAEMVKTDEHMKKIRQKLIADREAIERSQAAKKQRELKKFGKQVQRNVLEERAKQKRDNMDAVKKLRKDRENNPGNLDDDDGMFDVAVQKDDGGSKRKGDAQDRPNFKRMKKDQKYGFGGKKKGSKRNDHQSTSDMSGFNPHKNKAPIKGMPAKKKGGAPKRPGKARRQSMKGKRR